MLRQAQHERVWGVHSLIPHPDMPPSAVRRVDAQILSAGADTIEIEFHVSPAKSVRVPEEVPSARTDGLWRTTCFEAFLKPEDADSYVEINASPSFAWAAYAFSGYRDGMSELVIGIDPEIRASPTLTDHYFLTVEFERPCSLRGVLLVNLSAVIEEVDGTKSYWALAHPPGKPDFHDPACFVLALPAAG